MKNKKTNKKEKKSQKKVKKMVTQKSGTANHAVKMKNGRCGNVAIVKIGGVCRSRKKKIKNLFAQIVKLRIILKIQSNHNDRYNKIMDIQGY